MKKIVMLAMLSAAFLGCEDQAQDGAGDLYSVSVLLGDKDQGSVNIYEHESKFESGAVGCGDD